MQEHEHAELLPDDQLLSNIKQGCSVCFEDLFRRYCRQVYSVAFRILRDFAVVSHVPCIPAGRLRKSSMRAPIQRKRG
jgi:hypothetical protein